MIRLLFIGLLFLQDGELDRLIQQLGDGDPARREEAVRKLREIGPRAKDSVTKALQSSDPEVRARATALLDHFERERLQSILEAAERKKLFPRITMQAVDAPRREVLAELSRQSGWVWDSGKVPMEDKVTLKGVNLPMMEALDQIGVEWWFRVSGEDHLYPEKRAREEVAAFEDGMRFLFSRRIWKPDGVPVGTVLETQKKIGFQGAVRWTVAAVKTDREWPIETCAIHSPDRVYVASPDLENARVTIKGTRLWYCPTPVEFAAPKNGDSRRVGSCEVTIEWPSLRIRLDHPMEEELMKKILTERDIDFKFKAGRQQDTMGVGVGGGGGGRFGGRFGGKNQAWCRCEGQPAMQNPNPPPMAKELLLKVSIGTVYPLSDLSSMKLTLYKPVEDAFELTSPPLK